MSKEVESADLIMKLYDLRREAKMREARAWYATFFPESPEDVMKAMINAETSAYYRMVTSYWDMAASFVNHGAIDEDMFFDTNGECWVIFSKIHPFMEGIRNAMASPKYLGNLEKLLMKQPNAAESLLARREMMASWIRAREEMAGKGA
jgi:hypothetical protein